MGRVRLLKKEPRKRYIAIDPGVSGAIAVLRDPVERLTVHPLPTLSSGKGGKRELDIMEVLILLEINKVAECFCLIERVSAMPGQGVTSSFTFGDSFGCLRTAVMAVKIPHGYVAPNKWKGAMGLRGKPKEYSLRMAKEEWPHVDFGKNKRVAVNCADAALMALYARRMGL